MDKFKVFDPDFEKKVRDSFQRQGLMTLFGARLLTVKPGYCEIEVPFKKELAQQHGYFHAGVTGAVLDSACGYAAFTLMPSNCTVLTVEYKLNLVAPAEGDSFVAQGKVVKSGRLLKVCTGEVFARKNGRPTLCAVSLSTILAKEGEPDGPG